MNRRQFLNSGIALGAVASMDGSSMMGEHAGSLPAGLASMEDRDYWLRILQRVGHPVLQNLSEGKLKQVMPIESPKGKLEDRRQYTHLEAFGRLMCGIAPWLELGSDASEEGKLRQSYATLARAALHMATDPTSPDFLNFNKGQQPVVDAAFLALAILRAPTALWSQLDPQTRRYVVNALESSRVIKPGYNNWLLFSAVIEAALSTMGVWWDPMRVDYAIRSLDSWYQGDGLYGDGPHLHCDYYNSYVMHPLLLATLDTLGRVSGDWKSFEPEMRRRSVRYAAIQERTIGPDGSFPPIGRSLCYRFGAFHLLADISLRRLLPEPLQPSQARSALTQVMRRMIEAPGTFDSAGWLTVGFCGHQPSMAEPYISTGSLYLCSAAWLPLGLPSSDPFWTDQASPWTSRQAWTGGPVPTDHALTS